ncbi:MAG: hypothetical protein ABIU96_04115 [Rhodanobacter sp.]
MTPAQLANLWLPGHVSHHDLSAAGRASRKVSTWGQWQGLNRPMPKRLLSERRLELIKRAAARTQPPARTP